VSYLPDQQPLKEEFWAREAYIDLVREAAGGLCSWLRPRASLPSPPKAMTSAEAELALRRGHYFQNRYNNLNKMEDFNLGLEALQQALAIDPSLAQAAALIAFMYGNRWENTGDEEASSELERWARKAIDIDPGNSLAWMTATWVREIVSPEDITGQLQGSLKAAMLGPREAISQLQLAVALERASIHLSLVAIREAKEVDPLYLYTHNGEALYLWLLGRPEEALPMAESIIRLEPDSFGLEWKWRLLQELGRTEEADSIFERAFALAESSLSLFGPEIMLAHLALNRPDIAPPGALENALHLLDDPEISPWRARFVAYYLLPPATRTGRLDLALRLIDRLEGRQVPLAYDLLTTSPVFDPLRDDVRFTAVVATARSRFETYLELLEAARARGELPPYLEQPLDDLRTRLGM
jgi:tetratricopeptide (TPR) repeat protein